MGERREGKERTHPPCKYKQTIPFLSPPSFFPFSPGPVCAFASPPPPPPPAAVPFAPLPLFVIHSLVILFHNLLFVTHSPEISRSPVSSSSNSARIPRRLRRLTRKEMGVTMPSLGVGRREPRARTELCKGGEG